MNVVLTFVAKPVVYWMSKLCRQAMSVLAPQAHRETHIYVAYRLTASTVPEPVSLPPSIDWTLNDPFVMSERSDAKNLYDGR